MNQIDRYIMQILNLSSRDIASIESYHDENGHIIAYIMPVPKIKDCPYCGNTHIVSKGYRKDRFITPTNNSSTCKIIFSLKRYQCRTCNHSFSERAIMAPSHAKLSYQTIMKIMDLLQNPSMTFTLVAKLLSVSTQTVIRTFDNYCRLSHVSLPEALCIDEVYTKNIDFDHSKYSCIFYDFYNRTIVDVAPTRRKDYLLNYLEKAYSKQERDNVRIVSIDMYQPYKDVIRSRFKNAIISVDSFHVIKLLNDCVSKVRIRIMKLYEPSSIEYYLLKQWKFLLFFTNIDLDNKGRFNKRLNRYINYRGILEQMLKIYQDIEKAYELKDKYIVFNRASHDTAEALNMIHELYNEFLSSSLPEFMPLVSALGNWDNEIANSFRTYKGRRISSGTAEGLNQIISTIIFNSKGIRNSERRKKRIMYVVNKNAITF